MKKVFSIIAAFMLALCMPALAFAEGGNGSGGGGGGGNGSGGGNGGGSTEPLVVESASITDGAQINASNSITLVFSKNVCEASVRDANMALASVKDAQGASVPITVQLADDQVEPDKKNDMVIVFNQPLQEGAYTLTAQAGITSKSDDSLAEDYVLHFTVAPRESSASASAASASASSASASSSSASSSSASSSSTSAAPASNSSNASQQGGPGLVVPIVIGIVAVVVIIAVVVLAKKRK